MKRTTLVRKQRKMKRKRKMRKRRRKSVDFGTGGVTKLREMVSKMTM